MSIEKNVTYRLECNSCGETTLWRDTEDEARLTAEQEGWHAFSYPIGVMWAEGDACPNCWPSIAETEIKSLRTKVGDLQAEIRLLQKGPPPIPENPPGG